jgi:hypothetical protein
MLLPVFGLIVAVAILVVAAAIAFRAPGAGGDRASAALLGRGGGWVLFGWWLALSAVAAAAVALRSL